MKRDKKARYSSESKKSYKKRQKKNKKEKDRLQNFQIVRSEEEKEEDANEITTSCCTLKLINCFGFVFLYSCYNPAVEELEISKLEHDPSSNSTCASISEEDLEELMTSIKKDFLVLVRSEEEKDEEANEITTSG
ncbi:hypothetical protein MKX03_022649, partial [Papaver bracteatum]